MLYWYYKKEGRCVTVKDLCFPFCRCFFDRLCRRGGFLGGCAIHGCPSARNCGDCRDTTARRNLRGRGDARTHC